MASSSSSSSRSWKYDVFLSFRGEDTRKTFVDHLYSALQQRAILTYKDDVTLNRGDTISPSLLKAIESSQILVIIFSENYADSSWCLDELSHIMKCRDSDRGQLVMPIFYHVDPSDVRKQKWKYGEAFAKHVLENGKNKVETWKKALFDASNIAGWEPKHVANGHEAQCIKEIVGSILEKLSSLDSTVEDEDLVGMGYRLEQLKSQLRIGSCSVRMVGIWGLGGGGKSTLATSLYLQISPNFDGCCFLGNIREETKQHGLQSLQEKVLLAVGTKMQVQSVEIGKHTIKRMLCRRNVLIVLDDVDHLEQLEALAGSHNWFGNGSRIIITTRDEQVLKSHRVDEVCPVSLLSHDEAIRLFKRHAYQEHNPVEDYGKLSLRVISYVNGLPLALKILGAFLYGKDKDEWISTLTRLKDHPEMDIMEKLKISYDGLKPVEKELFLDIACFYRRERKDGAMEMLDACGFHPRIGVKVLIQKTLISVSKHGYFEMHDLVQEMAHYIVRGEHPNNPEKHSRLWRVRDVIIVKDRTINKNIIGGERLLETMLQGNAVERGCMSLTVQGLEIARGFEAGLVKGGRCGMQLPDNWFNDFSGFLICAASDEWVNGKKNIIMKHVEKSVGGWMGMGDSQHHDLYWEEDTVDEKITWVGYIPFSILRHTSWWDPTSTAIHIQIDLFNIIGLKLVPKRGGGERSGQMETTTHSSSSSSEISVDDDDYYKCDFEIEHDYESRL